MKNIFIGFFLVFSGMFNTNAAIELNDRGLSEEQKAKLQVQIEEMKKEKSKMEEQSTIDTAVKYSEIGKSIGVAIGETAKSLNVAVNDFVKTPVGKATFCILAWKIAGKDFIRYVVGYFVIFCTAVTWIYFYRKIYINNRPIEKIEYGPGWWVFRSKNITFGKAIQTSEAQDAFSVIFAVLILVFAALNTLLP